MSDFFCKQKLISAPLSTVKHNRVFAGHLAAAFGIAACVFGSGAVSLYSVLGSSLFLGFHHFRSWSSDLSPSPNCYDKATPELLEQAGASGNLLTRLHSMAHQMGLRRDPELYVTKEPDPEAKLEDVLRCQEAFFASASATGGKSGQSMCTMTRPFLSMMADDEHDAVMAHELAHIRQHNPLKTRVLHGIAQLTLFSLAVQTAYEVCASKAGLLTLGLALAVGTLGYAGLKLFNSARKTQKDKIDPLVFPILCYMAASGLLAGPILFGTPRLSVLFVANAMALAANFTVFSSFAKHTEFEADRLSAEITGDPISLASALSKLEEYNEQAGKGLDEKFLSMHSPLRIETVNNNRKILKKLSLHPSTDERIDRLLNLCMLRKT